MQDLVLASSHDEHSPALEGKNWRRPGERVDTYGRIRTFNPNTDYGALAGEAERKCMELLGFRMTLPGEREPIKVGNGIGANGFITDQRVLEMWGVWPCKPSHEWPSKVWGSEGKAIQNASDMISRGVGA